MNQSCSVVVLAAGQGTRMKSALPKVLHRICGRSLVGHALMAAAGINPETIIAVVRHEKELVSAEVTNVCPTAIVAEQDEIPGTGRAVDCALQAAAEQGIVLRGTIVVTSGDVPLLESATLTRLVDAHRDAGAAVTVMTTIAPDPSGYGRVIRDEQGLVARIVEHKDASSAELHVQEINAGIYAFDAEFLRQALSQVDQENSQGEVYLTDTVGIAVKQGLSAGAFVLEDQWQAEGCNDLVQLATLRTVLNGRLLEKHMRAGARIVDPATTSIDVDVTIAPDAVIFPGVQLWGSTTIGANAVIGPQTTLENANVGQGGIVPHSVVRDDSVGAGEQLAPFSVRQPLTPGH